MTIYTSDVVLPRIDVFRYMFPQEAGDSPIPMAARNPNLVSYICGMTGRQLKRGELEESAKRLACGLKKRDIGRGDTTLLLGPNSLDWIVAAWGMQAAGVTVSPANVAYGPKELAHQFNDSGSKAIILAPMLLPVLEKARPLFKNGLKDEHIIVLSGTGKYRSIYEIMDCPRRPEQFEGDEADSTAWLCYSSGTTGLPKGVMSSHFNMTSQIQCITPCYPDLKPDTDAILGVLPMSHIFGLMALVHQPLTIGVPVVVYPRFDELAVLDGIQKYKITYAIAVPPILLLLVHSQNTAKYDITSLKTLQSGAAPLSGELAAAFEKKFPHCQIAQGWGLTETSPAITYCKAEDAAKLDKNGKNRKGSVGKLIPSYELRLVGDDGKDVPEGQRGELWVAGPSVMTGYHNNPEATRKTMDGKWFKTGDVGVRDDEGWYWIVDRVKELIKYKGFQVPPAELEALLLEHPQLLDCGVVGVWDETQATELPRAYVVAKPGLIKNAQDKARIEKEVAEWVRERVAQHKRLRGGVVVLDAIPKSPSGKILRKDLRVQAQKELEAEKKGKAKL
ncbi:hypothetical protein CcaverHIS002_0109220 [Cutaneotrichosporon cavernicola]|uniref:AMP binding protein n=1 Tax=Cutaneotrichosporon cavernicola TaxID=279322 RepID=A0AA48HZ77_9TREE|nr:uncharacterized protein CcaverHIS019_0109140 [Cutaneotrichosporon cavernicola]BEI80393.1 hypothetical protein CcaverHIS002_0109220 [Cutaneotrichosporon cavernicola]BEI88196.1 hypothetical protein CcaverHIS019_0109140 [Cutaneotrichosporon cavernicola]BEI95967.1 hypothetical protein CcaverHIS631_0109160 [Cutaneotrichosporon cavernicola]BEJ03741.1 hypothetical protein CcaverHIS641_0109160 [Cutaneotrichosporon cavernicola]